MNIPLLEVKGLKKEFVVGSSFFKKNRAVCKAVYDVSFTIY